jgi:hypothetical protein
MPSSKSCYRLFTPDGLFPKGIISHSAIISPRRRGGWALAADASGHSAVGGPCGLRVDPAIALEVAAACLGKSRTPEPVALAREYAWRTRAAKA